MTIRANRKLEPTPLTVGDHVVLGFGDAPTTWTVVEIVAKDHVVLTTPRRRKPEGGLTRGNRKVLPWHEIARGRAERLNQIPILEAIYA